MDEKDKQIIELFKAGASASEISSKVKLSSSTIRTRILRLGLREKRVNHVMNDVVLDLARKGMTISQIMDTVSTTRIIATRAVSIAHEEREKEEEEHFQRAEDRRTVKVYIEKGKRYYDLVDVIAGV